MLSHLVRDTCNGRSLNSHEPKSRPPFELSTPCPRSLANALALTKQSHRSTDGPHALTAALAHRLREKQTAREAAVHSQRPPVPQSLGLELMLLLVLPKLPRESMLLSRRRKRSRLLTSPRSELYARLPPYPLKPAN